MIIIIILACMLMLVTLASSSQIQSEKNARFGFSEPDESKNYNAADKAHEETDFTCLPDNFNFKIVWNDGGRSAYDSADGKLTTGNGSCGSVLRRLNLAEKKAIKEILSRIDAPEYTEISGYRAEYDFPGVNEPAGITLTIHCRGIERTISCPSAAGEGRKPDDARFRSYSEACRKIIGIITGAADNEALTAKEIRTGN